MTCRHQDGDPSCTSWPSRLNAMRVQSDPWSREDAYKKLPDSPDSMKFQILDSEQIGFNLVLKILYPNCVKCSYEGIKIIVFWNSTTKDALLWEKIDPHFREPVTNKHTSVAPPPAARFPGNDQGWQDAIWFAKDREH